MDFVRHHGANVPSREGVRDPAPPAPPVLAVNVFS